MSAYPVNDQKWKGDNQKGPVTQDNVILFPILMTSWCFRHVGEATSDRTTTEILLLKHSTLSVPSLQTLLVLMTHI